MTSLMMSSGSFLQRGIQCYCVGTRLCSYNAEDDERKGVRRERSHVLASSPKLSVDGIAGAQVNTAALSPKYAAAA